MKIRVEDCCSTRHNLLALYLLLSAMNGAVLFFIALLFSIHWVWALVVWLIASLVSFLLISLVCLRSAISRKKEDESGNPSGNVEGGKT